MTKPKKTLSPREKIIRNFRKLIVELDKYAGDKVSLEEKEVACILDDIKSSKTEFQEVTR